MTHGIRSTFKTGLRIVALASLGGFVGSLDRLVIALWNIVTHQYLKYGMTRLILNDLGAFSWRHIILTLILTCIFLAVLVFKAFGGLKSKKLFTNKIFDNANSFCGYKPVKIILLGFIGVFVMSLGIFIFSGFVSRDSHADRPNVIFICVDTLRADHLSCYGYQRRSSPHIDQLAKGATLFERCITTIPRTTQSLAAIFTGRYPQTINVRYLTDKMPKKELSIAEILKNDNYQTMAVIGTGIPYQRLSQGFDEVVEAKPDEEFRAVETTEYAVEYIRQAKGKYFLFVHYYDPHMPYEPPGVVFDKEYMGRFRDRMNYYPGKSKCVYRNSYEPRLREHSIALYDSEIFYTDQAVGRLIDEIRKKDDNNIIVFFSDHGESLGEHDFYYDHGDYLYQPSLHVPLIIEGIDFGKKRISDVVRTIDIVPTLLPSLKLEVPNAEFEGVDLRRSRADLEAYSETGYVLKEIVWETKRRFVRGLEGRFRSLTLNQHKLIYIPKENKIDYEYYDLSKDPKELENISSKTNIKIMKDKLNEWVLRDEKNWTKKEKKYTPDERESLKSFSYL